MHQEFSSTAILERDAATRKTKNENFIGTYARCELVYVL